MQVGLEAVRPAVTQIMISALFHERTYSVEYGSAQSGPGPHVKYRSAEEAQPGGETHSTVLGAMVSTRLPVRGEYGINVQAERDVLKHSLRSGFGAPIHRCAGPEEGHVAFGKISNGDHARFRSSQGRLWFMLSVRGPESQRLFERRKEPPAPSSPMRSLRLSNGIEGADAK